MVFLVPIILILLIAVILDVRDHAKKAKAKCEIDNRHHQTQMVSDEVKKLRAQKIVDWEARMDELYQKYLSSPLTQEIVDYLCSDSGVSITPIKIIVGDSFITASYPSKQSIIFDFLEHQIPNFMSPEQNPDLAKIMNGHTFFNSEDPDIFISLFKMEQILLNPREAFSKALNTLLSNKYTLCEADNFTGIKDPDNYRFRMNESIGYLSNFGEASESYAYTNNNDLVSAYLVGCTMLTLKPTNNF